MTLHEEFGIENDTKVPNGVRYSHSFATNDQLNLADCFKLTRRPQPYALSFVDVHLESVLSHPPTDIVDST